MKTTILQQRTEVAAHVLTDALHDLAAALGRVETVSGGLLQDGDVFISPGLWGVWAQNLRAQLDNLQPLGDRCNAAYLRFVQAYQTLAQQGTPDLAAPYGPVWATYTDTIADLVTQYERYELAYYMGHYLSSRTPAQYEQEG